MSYGADTFVDHPSFDGGRVVRGVLRQTVPGSAALAVGALVGAWILYGRPAGPSFRADAPRLAAELPAPGAVAPALKSTVPPVAEGRPVKPGAMIALRSQGVHVAEVVAPVVSTVAANPYGVLLDPGFSGGVPPALLAQISPLDAPLQPAGPPVAVASVAPGSVPPAEPVGPGIPVPLPRPAELSAALEPPPPLPAPRPPELSAAAEPPAAPPLPAPRPPLRAQASQQARAADPQSPPDHRNFLEKLFGLSSRPSGPQLAYAAPEDGGITRLPGAIANPAAGYDRSTAIYDIAAHTVYMPSGQRLEAHSGLGNRLDDPRYVNERNRGATPPAVYELQPREQLFHGVQALRLNPVGGEVYGRNGLLAHTFMLGARGDSNGCVSFRNYNAFLQAYMHGEVKRLVVVARLN